MIETLERLENTAKEPLETSGIPRPRALAWDLLKERQRGQLRSLLLFSSSHRAQTAGPRLPASPSVNGRSASPCALARVSFHSTGTPAPPLRGALRFSRIPGRFLRARPQECNQCVERSERWSLWHTARISTSLFHNKD
jgi:hypothetical protein